MKTYYFISTAKTMLYILFLAGLTWNVKAQSALDRYIEEGLKQNLVLQQKDLTLEQAQQSLKAARSYFLPSITLLADYTSGSGGRSIAIPVGDLLNPVYASLNQLTGSDEFPQIDNVEQNFFPNNFYDAKVRTSIPLFNTDLHVNKNIQQQKTELSVLEIEIYQRQLVMDIKVAYYNYMAAQEAVKIYESALTLVNKNVELNESLLKNGKSLPANYLRAKSEADQVKADLNSARNQVENARYYFNFLLNKELNSVIESDHYSLNEILSADTTTSTIKNREEIKIIQQARNIDESVLQLNRLSRLPKINAFVDLGSQASDWQYNDKSRYYLFGVQFSMPLFQGFRNNITIRQSTLSVQKRQLELDQTSRALTLAIATAQNNFQTTWQNYQASSEQLKSSLSYFKLIDKGYQQGVNSLIEFLDARNQLTRSELQQNLRRFDVLSASAKLERETASYTLKK